MKNVIDFSLDNRLIVLIAWFLVCAIGVESMLQLPIDAVPDVTNVQVQILTNSPGLAPEEVERFITFPVETAMSGLPSIEEIRSVSKFGLSVVTVVFDEGTDIYWARQLVGERLVEAREQIPKGYGEPSMGPISSGLGEIYQFEVRGKGYSPMELRSILDWNVNYQLRSVPGIVEVNSFGGELKTYQVTLDAERLTAHSLTVGDVLEAIRENNRNVGGGYIAHQGEQYLIRGEGLIERLEDLGEIVLEADEVSGTPVRIADVAKVEFAPMIRQGAVTRDGQGEAVVGIVMMLMGENSRTVVERVKSRIEGIRKSLPEGVTIETFYDRTELIDRTIHTVAKNLAEGAVLVIVVLLLLLGNFTGGLLVASAIPISLLFAFILMRAFGVSGNLMSLGALDFGIIVDGAVVVIENVVRYLHENKDADVPHLEKIRAACHEVARPVVFAVGIITIVYVPILALRGVEGKMFRPMALTVMFALVGSLICALTLMPVLASFLLKSARETEPWLFRISRGVYLPILGLVMRFRTPVVALAVGGFMISLLLLRSMGAEFIPKLDEGAIAMQIWRLPSISLEKSNEISTLTEAHLKNTFPEIDTIVSRTGRAEIATDPMGVEISDTYVMLRPRSTWRYATKEDLIEAIEESLHENIPGAIFSFSQPIELRVSELISGVRSDVAIKLYGEDLDLLKQKADQIVKLVSEVPGAADVKAEQVIGLPTLRIRVDRRAIARYGIHAEEVLDVIEALGGASVGTVVEGQKRFDLQVRFGPDIRETLGSLRKLKIGAPPVQFGAPPRLVPLEQVARLSLEEGPAQISRENISRRITVEANVRGRDLASFVTEAQAVLDEKLEIPPGYILDWGGQFENLEAASKRLAVLVPIALLLIFALLLKTFSRAHLALLIFLNVPMAVTGGVLALVVRGYPLSISAGVGFIALCGIAVMNGVVLVSYMLDHQAEGHTPEQAARAGAEARLRAVLMTATTDALGFVPMAMATSAGAEVQRPLATVVIGGLVTAFVLTMLVLPAIYPWFAPADSGVEDD